MQLYQHGVLRKAQSLREAVQRGLQPPLETGPELYPRCNTDSLLKAGE